MDKQKFSPKSTKSTKQNHEKTYRILLRGRHLLYRKRIIQQTMAREVLLDILLHELNTQIWVVDGLDLVANTAD